MTMPGPAGGLWPIRRARGGSVRGRHGRCDGRGARPRARSPPDV